MYTHVYIFSYPKRDTCFAATIRNLKEKLSFYLCEAKLKLRIAKRSLLNKRFKAVEPRNMNKI